MSKTRCTGFSGFITYALLIASTVMIALVYWGCTHKIQLIENTYLVELQLANKLAVVGLRVGYNGACASFPNETASDIIVNASTGTYYNVGNSWSCDKNLMAENLTAGEIVSRYIESMNLASSPSLDYNTTLKALVELAEDLQSEVFNGSAILSAFVLVIVGGLISVLPIFFDHEKRSLICNLLGYLSALLIANAYMLTGAACLVTTRATKAMLFLRSRWPDQLDASSNVVNIMPGRQLQSFQLAATVMIGAFMLAAVVTYLLEHKRDRSARKVPQTFQDQHILPVYGNSGKPPKRQKGWFVGGDRPRAGRSKRR